MKGIANAQSRMHQHTTSKWTDNQRNDWENALLVFLGLSTGQPANLNLATQVSSSDVFSICKCSANELSNQQSSNPATGHMGAGVCRSLTDSDEGPEGGSVNVL